MNRKEFVNWVNGMLEWKPKRYDCWRIPDTTIVICVNKKNGKIGVAKCHPDDKFVISYGKAIAIARCAGIEVPTLSEYKMVGKLKNGDVFMYGGNKFRYIGKVSERNYAVANVLASDRLQNFYAFDDEEVEICS